MQYIEREVACIKIITNLNRETKILTKIKKIDSNQNKKLSK